MSRTTVHETNITSEQPTGNNISVPQYEANIEYKFSNAGGEIVIRNDLERYPNCVDNLAPAERRAVVREILIRCSRINHGIDTI